MASTVPLITPLSNPKRKPPSAATIERKMIFATLSSASSERDASSLRGSMIECLCQQWESDKRRMDRRPDWRGRRASQPCTLDDDAPKNKSLPRSLMERILNGSASSTHRGGEDACNDVGYRSTEWLLTGKGGNPDASFPVL